MTELIDKKVLEFKDLDEDEFVLDLSNYEGVNYFRFINVKIDKLKYIRIENLSIEFIDSQIGIIKDACLEGFKLINSYITDIDVAFINTLKSRNSKIEKTLTLSGVNVVDIESNDINIAEACGSIDIISVGNLNIFVCEGLKLNIKSFKEIDLKFFELSDDAFNGNVRTVELTCDLDNFSLQNLYSIKKVVEMEEVMPMNFNKKELDERIYILKNMNKSKSAKK